MVKSRKERGAYNPKHAATRALWRKNNPERTKEIARKYVLMKTYGITVEQYNDLLNKQNGGCAVCLKPASHFKMRLAVDHDHKTGEIFGLLCYPCNHKLIGRERSSDKHMRAAKYLEQGTGWFVPPKPKKRKRK